MPMLRRKKISQEVSRSCPVVASTAPPCSSMYVLEDPSEGDTDGDQVNEETINDADEDADEEKHP